MEIKIKEGVPLAGHFHVDVPPGVLVAVIDEENLIVNGARTSSPA